MAAPSAHLHYAIVVARKATGPRPPKAAHHFRLAPEAVANDMAGFQHNAVSPLGLKTEIFVVVAEAIAQLRSPFIWMGAGHVNLKLGCTTGHLTRALKPLIADISDPR